MLSRRARFLVFYSLIVACCGLWLWLRNQGLMEAIRYQTPEFLVEFRNSNLGDAALGKLSDLERRPVLIPELVRALKYDRSRQVRYVAADLLIGLLPETPELIPHLLAALQNDSDVSVRAVSASGLARLDPCPPELLSVLLRAYHNDVNLRATVVDALATIHAEDSETMLVLKGALDDPSEHVRGAALKALEQIGPESKIAEAKLIEFQAARVLCRISARHRKIGAAALNEMLTSSAELSSFGAAMTVRELGPVAEGTVPALITTLNHTHWNTRSEVCRALMEIGHRAKEAMPALIKTAQTDTVEEVRQDAAYALMTIAPDDNKVFAALFPWYIETLQKPHQAGTWDSWRLHAITSLGRFGSKAKVAEPLLRAAITPEFGLHEVAATHALARMGFDVSNQVPGLIRAVEWSNSNSTEPAETLGFLGPKAKGAVPALLLAAKNDRDHGLRLAAALALIQIDPDLQSDPAIDLIRNLAAADYTPHAVEAIAALGRVGPKAVPALVEILKEERRARRAAAATALGGIGPQAKGATSALQPYFTDKRPSVRRAVLTALGEIDPAASIPMFRAGLKDSAWSVRHSAVQGLAKVRSAGTLVDSLLREAQADSDADVREAANAALKQIQSTP